MSINSFYYADKRHGISEKGRDWQFNLFTELAKSPNKEIISNLTCKFNPVIHGYRMTIVYAAPAATFYNKSNGVSSKQIDLSNCEKSLVDVFFLPKYNGAFGSSNLNVDDKWLMELSSRKTVSSDEHYWTTVELQIIALPKCG